MATDTIDISKISEVPEDTKKERNNRKPITRTRIIRVFLLFFGSIGLMLNNLLYVTYITLVLKEYSDASKKDFLYFYGTLYASKDIALLVISPFAGYLIDQVGYDDPLVGGLGFILLSPILSAFADSYWLFFINRIFQGLASALTDISIMAMIADLFVKQRTRINAFGTVSIFGSLVLLVASPFASVLTGYLLENRITFLTFDIIVLVNGLILFFLMKRLRCIQIEENQEETTKSDNSPTWKLIINPYVILCAGSLMLSQTVLSFLIYVPPLWLGASVAISSNLEITCFLTILSYIVGIAFVLLITKKYPRHQWLIIAAGITVEGVCGLIVTLVNSYVLFMIPACGIAFGVALVRVVALPTLARLADAQQVYKYGSIYAVAYISYAIVDVIAPITLYDLISYSTLTIVFVGIAVLNILYAPLVYFLRNIY